MTTTFFLPDTSAGTARILFASWPVRVERVEYMKSCNVVTFDEDTANKFVEHAEKNGIEHQLV